ncbi:sulfite oxidase [Thamnocephalis sphaerospora]|uniref:Sulfite oxidase n=1 Tax=Thamnocephalis sphaerospora TaxID=78915 RepID=A0A4P9XVA5_9FUNG|nr:sulfite oxidase [Thamnocephalis sphaerospora]|eukprot:RKP10205.1 sulfite oxidase [Thamnocephalis sphaerospora]
MATTDEKRGPFDYSNDPVRPSPHLLVRKDEPFNAEPTLSALVRRYITPVPEFFKRNHGPIPDLDASKHTVSVEAPELPSITSRRFNMSELRQFPKREIIAAIQCAGNRRDGLNKLAKVKGVIWAAGTIGNATWAGATMRDVLLAAGVPEYDDPAVRGWHVSFEAIGECEEDRVYGSSIPLWMAMSPNRDVLLAYEMNGATLTRDHGYPIRVIVPGVIGARSVKWLDRITIQPAESNSFFQQRDYKILPPHVRENELAEWWPRLVALQELNVQSVICEPTEDQSVNGGPLTIRGYAISGAYWRMHVSVDGGRTWKMAELYNTSPSPERHWGWTLWALRVPKLSIDAELVCRAWDAAGNTQPELPVYNYRGVMNNAQHRIRVLPSSKV